MEIRFDGKLTIEGTSTGWTNPVIEAGLVHCRAMLEFLGLRLDHRKPDQLKERTNKHPDDVVIEDYGVDGRPLNRVTIADAVAKYAGPPDEAHQALARLIFTANKGHIHSTSETFDDLEQNRLLEIASRGVPSLVISYFYIPLGMPEPSYRIKSRKPGDECARARIT